MPRGSLEAYQDIDTATRMKPIRYLDPHRQSVREQGDLDAIFVQAQHRVLRHVRHYSSVMAIILRHAFPLTGRVYCM